MSFKVFLVTWGFSQCKNSQVQPAEAITSARGPVARESEAHLQLAMPTLLKPRGQLLVAQAAQEVQGVDSYFLWETSQRPGAGV